MISAAQIRAARALLGITAEDLARAAGVGSATIKRFETEAGVPASRSGTLKRLKAALESAGIEFMRDPIASAGLRLRRR
jgi:predicted transcriptional regulator